MASFGQPTLDRSTSPASKGLCGEHVLLVHGLPSLSKYPSPGDISEFFHPVRPKRVEHALDGNDKSTWKITFSSQKDMDASLDKHQWKWTGDTQRSVRLTRLEDHSWIQLAGKWDFIHQDLQLNVLAYFDVSHRARFRRVCKSWDEILEPFWDRYVNRCLFFESRESLRLALPLVVEQKRDLCGGISRPIINLRGYRNVWWPGRFSVISNYLVEHCHFRTVCLINMKFAQHDLRNVFTFGGSPRWPREMKIILHKCDIHQSYFFPSSPCFGEYNVIDHQLRWTESVTVDNIGLTIGPNIGELERFVQLQREINMQQLLRFNWPRDPRDLNCNKVEWLQSKLDGIKLDPDMGTLAILNKKGRTTLRQTIREYLKREWTRQTVGQWEPTGIFFEGMELNWRDYRLFYTLVYTRNLPGSGNSPDTWWSLNTTGDPKSGESYEKCLVSFSDTIEEFNEGLARLKCDGPHHCVFRF